MESAPSDVEMGLRKSDAASSNPAVPDAGKQRAVAAVLQLTEVEDDFLQRGFAWPHVRSVRELAETVGTQFLLFAGLQHKALF